jgi:pimeloyl-ACP methyl ester carboxylesterase
VALSPYCQPYVVNGSLGSIGIPVMYQGGTADAGITPTVKAPGGCFDKNSSPGEFVEFQGAGHFAWTDAVSTYQGLAVNYTRAFLDTHVRRSSTVDPAVRVAGVSDLRMK